MSLWINRQRASNQRFSGSRYRRHSETTFARRDTGDISPTSAPRTPASASNFHCRGRANARRSKPARKRQWDMFRRSTWRVGKFGLLRSDDETLELVLEMREEQAADFLHCARDFKVLSRRPTAASGSIVTIIRIVMN